MTRIQRILPLLFALAALTGCGSRGVPMEYGPEPGSGIELPGDATIEIYIYGGPADPLKTEWTEQERARLKEMLASLSLTTIKEGYTATYNRDGLPPLSLKIQAENFSLSSTGITCSVNGNFRYYGYSSPSGQSFLKDLEDFDEVRSFMEERRAAAG